MNSPRSETCKIMRKHVGNSAISKIGKLTSTTLVVDEVFNSFCRLFKFLPPSPHCDRAVPENRMFRVDFRLSGARCERGNTTRPDSVTARVRRKIHVRQPNRAKGPIPVCRGYKSICKKPNVFFHLDNVTIHPPPTPHQPS